ncbi:hypothetical protein SAMN05216505_103356 [Streptomyces prasinopilosus]|uniref:Uncharacterized protein n=1 Tax=Streptomyces prasinopilosus TaxID=67344 RepID=A0A1G6P0X5_9ACTN|nr:hypothetical protein SAMN05216505_103356 [Streptomyces prasinopilosus]
MCARPPNSPGRDPGLPDGKCVTRCPGGGPSTASPPVPDANLMRAAGCGLRGCEGAEVPGVPGAVRRGSGAWGKGPVVVLPYGVVPVGGPGRGHVPPAGSGRPRSRPFSWVTGLLSPAARSPVRSEVPRRTARSAHRVAPASHTWFCRARPWLARTPVPTRRSRLRSRAVRVRRAAHVRTRHGGPVPAGGPAGGRRTGRGGPAGGAFRRPGVRSCRGRAPAGSSRARCPACPGRPCSGRGPPSRGRGSRAGRRRRSVPAG